MDVLGLIAIIIFYALILAVGVWAGRKAKPGDDSEDVMLAGRNIGVIVGIFTMTATWVGGGYINGTAEMLYTSGLVWCQAPFGYSLSLVLGGVLFAEKMRKQGYVTMLDPFQNKYGERVGGIMFIPALLGEVFWSAAILSALGATLAVIMDIDETFSVIVSACIAVFYTFFGGLYAVAYTDVVQLFCIFVGLWLCIPAAILNPVTTSIVDNADAWIGELSGAKVWCQWIDAGLLLVFGGIPWQVYFQRVLSSKDPIRAKMLSYVAAVGCLIMAIPPILIGAIAKSAAWNETSYRPFDNKDITVYELPDNKTNMVLPQVLQTLTPWWVAYVGLGSVSAAVMSSADSSILSAASMFARNIWKLTIRPHASENEVLVVMRAGVVMVGIAATVMALTIRSVYGLWYLCADLVYVILFPQLLCVVHMQSSNTYGSLSGYIVGMLLRLAGGEALLSFPALIHYKWYDEETYVQYFPFRTLSMLLSLFTIVTVSLSTEYLFMNGKLPRRADFLKCVINIPEERLHLPRETSFATSTDTLAINLNKIKSENGMVNPLLSAHNNGASGNTSPANQNVPLNAETPFTYSSIENIG